MKKIVVANLKSSLSDSTAENYVSTINKHKYTNLILCPSYKYLHMFKSDNYLLGMQDIDDDINNLKGTIDYVMLGHYEKRIKGETNKNINKKIDLCLKNNLKVILCIGNNENEDFDYIKRQLDECLCKVDSKCFKDILIAYEPFYMIGKSKDIDINLIKGYINSIKTHISNKYHSKISVLYGGNVNESNINDLLDISDGVLVGRLSFDVNNFTQILQKV